MNIDFQSKPGDRQGEAVREIEHTADYALLIRGKDLGTLLKNAAMGLYSLVGSTGKASSRRPPIEKQLTLDAQDAEGLLVDWLSELAYWVETEWFIGSDIRFSKISDHHLKAAVKGYRTGGVEKLIKAVTYHDLRIIKTAKGLEATVIFDV
jgi:SHS2 domain-containing protein